MSADQFARELDAFALKMQKTTRRVFVQAATEVQRSVVEGSELTGAPGQPVSTGYLKTSFIGGFAGADRWRLTTNVSYAPAIEDNDRSSFNPEGVEDPRPPEPGAGTPKASTVGGHHSVKKTRAAWQRIVDHVTPSAIRGGP